MRISPKDVTHKDYSSNIVAHTSCSFECRITNVIHSPISRLDDPCWQSPNFLRGGQLTYFRDYPHIESPLLHLRYVIGINTTVSSCSCRNEALIQLAAARHCLLLAKVKKLWIFLRLSLARKNRRLHELLKDVLKHFSIPKARGCYFKITVLWIFVIFS